MMWALLLLCLVSGSLGDINQSVDKGMEEYNEQVRVHGTVQHIDSVEVAGMKLQGVALGDFSTSRRVGDITFTPTKDGFDFAYSYTLDYFYIHVDKLDLGDGRDPITARFIIRDNKFDLSLSFTNSTAGCKTVWQPMKTTLDNTVMFSTNMKYYNIDVSDLFRGAITDHMNNFYKSDEFMKTFYEHFDMCTGFKPWFPQ